MIITRETKGLIPWTDQNIEGKVVVVTKDFFKPEFQDAKYQLVVACGGFGCNPSNLGRAVFIQECTQDNPEDYRQECYNIIGLASDELIAEWKKEYGEFNEKALGQIAKER